MPCFRSHRAALPSRNRERIHCRGVSGSIHNCNVGIICAARLIECSYIVTQYSASSLSYS